MPAIAEGTSTVLAIKKQVGLTPASGAGATAIEVRPSAGLTRTVATIESQILHRSGMKRRARQGSESGAGSFATELLVGNLDLVFAGINTQTDAEVDIDDGDVTSLALATAGGVQTATVASGDLYALGLYASRWIKLAGMATAENNGKWVPVLSVPTANTFTIPVGILVDEAADLSFTMTVAKAYRAPAVRVKEYYTVEELLDIAMSKYSPSARFTGLTFGAQANQMVTAEFTMAGLQRRLLTGATTPASPIFTAPTYGSIAGAESMSMLDGAIYINGEDIMTLTSLTMGVSANSAITPLLRSRTGLSVSVPSFGFTGQFSGVLTDDSTFFEDAEAETPLFIATRFAQSSDPGSDFVGVVIPNATYGNADAPIVDGDTLVNLPLYAGRETRLLTEGWPENSTMVISTSAP